MYSQVFNVLPIVLIFSSIVYLVSLVVCLSSENDFHYERHFSERERTFFDDLMDDYRKIFNPDTMVCHDICETPLLYANTYTPHSVIANLTTVPYEFPGCHPVKLWLLIRHGARTLDTNTRQASSKILPRIRHHILYSRLIGKGDLDEETITFFKNWTEKLPTNNEKSLTLIGQEEMFDLAIRTRKRYPQFFKSNYSEFQHEFRSSMKHRTKDSAFHFARGLFPNELHKVRFETSRKDDLVLRFHNRCRLWSKTVDRNSSTYDQLDKFLSGPRMAETLIRISDRLGLNYTLDYSEAKLILRYCAAQFAWDKGDSPWCHVLSEEELKILDHADDIRKYYLHSYPSEINYKQAYPLVREMMEFLGTKVSHDKLQAQFLFSHSGSILKFITAIGLFEDKHHLNENNWQNKTWRGSFVDAFASNYASILYRDAFHFYREASSACQAAPRMLMKLPFRSEMHRLQYKCSDNVDKVLTLYQERPMILKNCSSMLCPLKVLQESYKDSMSCNFDKICRNKKRKKL